MYERLFQISHIYTSSTNMWARAEYERWAEEADISTDKKAPVETLMKQNEGEEPSVGDQQKKKGGESGSGIGSEKEKDDGGKL